jgi:hypothetical protein
VPASTAAYDREDAPRALTAAELPQGDGGGLPVPDEVGEEGRGVLLLDEAQVEQQVGGLEPNVGIEAGVAAQGRGPVPCGRVGVGSLAQAVVTHYRSRPSGRYQGLCAYLMPGQARLMSLVSGRSRICRVGGIGTQEPISTLPSLRSITSKSKTSHQVPEGKTMKNRLHPLRRQSAEDAEFVALGVGHDHPVSV